MNMFALSGLVVVISSLLIGFLVLIKNPRNYLARIWFLYTCSVGWWGFGSFKIGLAKDAVSALYWWRVAHVGVIFIPVLLLHFIHVFLNKKNNWIVIVGYCFGFIFLVLNFMNKFIVKVELIFDSIYYDGRPPTLSYLLFVIFWIMSVIYVYSTSFLELKKVGGLRREQIRYFVLTFIGFLGGTTCYFPVFNIDIYPFGNFIVPFYTFFIAYGIFKYRLMDISIAITRTSIFVLVYSIILGIPFALAFGLQHEMQRFLGKYWWFIPLLVSTVLASTGPYLYSLLQRRAEDQLLKEQRQYQATLRRASRGMGRIKDLKRLLSLIVQIVTRTVRIEHCEVYLFHEASDQYVLKASKGCDENRKKILSVLPVDSALARYVLKVKEPIVYEEIKNKVGDRGDKKFLAIIEEMEAMQTALILPSFIEHRLIALISLGKLRSGKLYSNDDLVVFSILANQSALAIENAQFYDDMKRTHKQLFRAEKMATIGTMADGLSHQINNRLHAMGFIAGDALDTIKIKQPKKVSKAVEEIFSDLTHALNRIQENVKRGGDIVEGLLKYTRKGDEGFEAVTLDQLIDASIEMAQFKVKIDKIDLHKKYSLNLDRIRGNFTQLQEVFFNVIDNSYDAMMQRQNEIDAPNYRGVLTITAQKRGKNLEVSFKDNGIGVEPADIKKLFTPFFTTKASSKKGTGLGLYVIRQIVEENHKGKVKMFSDVNEGTETIISLPIFVD